MRQKNEKSPPDLGVAIYELVERLYPICRSITGRGVRETLQVVSEYVPLKVHEIPTGTKVFDWTVPKEWNITDAYVEDPQGRRVIDFANSNLHVVSYSVPVRATMPLAKLKSFLYTLPERPEWIPYRTSYYNETWGFCLTHRQLNELEDGDYRIVIDSSLGNGHLTYGESFLPGQSADEVILFTHVCHPSLCNDNLSGVAVLAYLGRYLSELDRRYSYRLVFAPGTIGSITCLAAHHLQP